MRAEGGPPLANMSAPPRSTLVLNPFKAAPGRATNWGLAFCARVDLDLNLRALWPGWARGLVHPEPGRRRHLRLCGALAVLAGVHPASLEHELFETLCDDLLRRAPAADLPPLMLASRATAEARTPEPDPLRALAILTHLSGRTCDPAGTPLLSEALQEGHAIDLWTAEAPRA